MTTKTTFLRPEYVNNPCLPIVRLLPFSSGRHSDPTAMFKDNRGAHEIMHVRRVNRAEYF